MSLIKGTPVDIENGARLTVQLSTPYQRGDIMSKVRYEATWDGQWIDVVTGLELDIPMPRYDSGDPQATGEVVMHLTQSPANRDHRATARLTYDAATWGETAPGELSLTVNPRPIAWVATAGLLERLNNFDGTAQSVINAAELEAERARQFAADAERASWDAVALAATGAGRKSAVSLPDMPMDPGLYNIINGAEAGQTWERLADGSQVRRPELEAASKTALDEEVAALDAAKLSVDMFQAQRTAIPLLALSVTDPQGDFRQRVADAVKYKKPLDGAGQRYEIPLSGATSTDATLDMTGVRAIRNADIRLAGAFAPAMRWNMRNQSQTIMDGFVGTRGQRRLTIPGHGCKRGDTLRIFGRQESSVGRAYYRTGGVHAVVGVVDANTVMIADGLWYDFPEAYPAVVVRTGREAPGVRLDDVAITYAGGESDIRQGIIAEWVPMFVLNGFHSHNFNERHIMFAQSRYWVGGGTMMRSSHYTDSGNSYGISAADLSIGTVSADLAGMRHCVAGGGGSQSHPLEQGGPLAFPGILSIPGGVYAGGEHNSALDAHGNMYMLMVGNAVVQGGINVGAKHNYVSASTITSGPVGALYGADEGQPDSSWHFSDLHLIRPEGSRAIALIQLERAWAADGSETPVADTLYDGAYMNNIRLEYNGPTEASARCLRINASMKRLEMGAITLKRRGAFNNDQRSEIAWNRVRDRIHVDVRQDGERLSFYRAAKTDKGLPILEQTPGEISVMAHVRNVPMYSTLGAVDIAGASDLSLGNVSVDINARGNPATPLVVRYADTLRLRAIQSGNVTATQPSSQYQVGAWLGDIGEVILSPDTDINEPLDTARFAITLSNVGKVRAPSGRLKGRLAGTYVAAGTTVWERDNLQEGSASTTFPTLRGTYTASNLSVAASSTSTFNVATPGAAVGDVVMVGPPADLHADLRYTARVSTANTVQVRLHNSTASAISHSGTWTTRVLRS